MKMFMIKRELPDVGTIEREQLKEAAKQSNEVLHELGPDIQWNQSYVAGNKTFCVYHAKDKRLVHEHAKRSGFPANEVTEIKRMTDPTTEAG